MEVALLSEELLKVYSPIRDDVTIKKFVPYVILAQRIYLRPMLGRALYLELQEQIKAADQYPDAVPYPITPENQALLQEIAMPLALYTTYQGLPYHWAQIVDKGLLLHKAENGESIDAKGLGVVMRSVRNDANTALGIAESYIKSCGLYPSWRPEREDCGCEVKPARRADTGLLIPKRLLRRR